MNTPQTEGQALTQIRHDAQALITEHLHLISKIRLIEASPSSGRSYQIQQEVTKNLQALKARLAEIEQGS